MKKYFKTVFTIIGAIWLTCCQAEELTIRFAMEATYPPFESIDTEGEITGFDVDIAKSICEKINATCSFVNSPWDSLIPGLKLGKFDAVISALAITSKREQQVAFSQPYYFDTASFVAAESDPIDPTLEGLKGKSVGVQGGTAMENYMRGFYKNGGVDVKNYASITDAFLDLKSGRIDAVLADTPIAKSWIASLVEPDYKIIGEPISDSTYFGSGLGIAINKKNTDLLQKINQGLNAIKEDGTYDKLVKKYFGN